LLSIFGKIHISARTIARTQPCTPARSRAGASTPRARAAVALRCVSFSYTFAFSRYLQFPVKNTKTHDAPTLEKTRARRLPPLCTCAYIQRSTTLRLRRSGAKHDPTGATSALYCAMTRKGKNSHRPEQHLPPLPGGSSPCSHGSRKVFSWGAKVQRCKGTQIRNTLTTILFRLRLQVCTFAPPLAIFRFRSFVLLHTSPLYVPCAPTDRSSTCRHEARRCRARLRRDEAGEAARARAELALRRPKLRGRAGGFLRHEARDIVLEDDALESAAQLLSLGTVHDPVLAALGGLVRGHEDRRRPGVWHRKHAESANTPGKGRNLRFWYFSTLRASRVEQGTRSARPRGVGMCARGSPVLHSQSAGAFAHDRRERYGSDEIRSL